MAKITKAVLTCLAAGVLFSSCQGERTQITDAQWEQGKQTVVIETKRITAEDAQITAAGLLTPDRGKTTMLGERKIMVEDIKPVIEVVQAAININDGATTAKHR